MNVVVCNVKNLKCCQVDAVKYCEFSDSVLLGRRFEDARRIFTPTPPPTPFEPCNSPTRVFERLAEQNRRREEFQQKHGKY